MVNKIPPDQVEKLARDVGFKELHAKIMVAVAYAESGLDADEVSKPNTDGTIDVGLWQINSIHRKKNPTWTIEWLRVPHNNALAAYALSNKGKTLQPWDASKDGDNGWKKPAEKIGDDYINHIDSPLIPNFIEKPLDKVNDGLDKVVGAAGDVWDATTATAHALESVVKAIGKAGGWLGNPHNWLRIAYVGLGAGVVLAGLSKLIGYDAGVLPTAALAKASQGAKATANAGRAAAVSKSRSGVGSGEVLARGGHS